MSDAELDAMTEEEWEDLAVVNLEFAAAMNYLARHELGLAPTRDELTARQEEVILFVAQARQKQQREQSSNDNDPRNEEFRREAEPEEQDVSDADLMRIANQGKRRR